MIENKITGPVQQHLYFQSPEADLNWFISSDISSFLISNTRVKTNKQTNNQTGYES